MEVESPAGGRPQQRDPEHQTRPKPCGEMGAGEHPCAASPVSRGVPCGPHAPGERGDWATAVGDDSPCSESTSEYLTPAGSLFSLEFYCSTLEVFPSEQLQAAAEEEPSRPTSSGSSSSQQRQEETVCPDTASLSPSAVEELPDTAPPSPTPVEEKLPDTEPTSPEEEEELPVARIVDVPGQRVDFRNTPSTLSPLSSRGYSLSQEYRNLADEGSSCDASSSDIRSSSSGQHRGAFYSPGSPLFVCASLSSEGCPSLSPSSPAAPPRREPSLAESTFELERRLVEDPLATRVKRRTPRRRGRRLWASLWAGLRRRFQRWSLVRRQRKQRRQGGSLLRQSQNMTAQVDREDEDDITSSDEFYTDSARWNVRKLYQRFVSCLHAVTARRGS